MNKLFTGGGLVASIVLIAFGIGCVAIGLSGRGEVQDNLKREHIVGTPDMDKAIAGKPIENGDDAKKFANGIRKHTLEATDNRTYAEMGRFVDASGKETDDPAKAAKDPKSGQPMDNPARNIWVTSTALSTALNTSFFAEQVATFAIVMGIALLLTGIGFLVLTLSLRRHVPGDGAAAA
jgi:hypothetical protein